MDLAAIPTQAANLNNMKTGGIYFISSAENSPDGNNGFLIVMKGTSNHMKQIWMPYRTPGSNDNHLYIRGASSGTYAAWAKYDGTIVS